MNTVNSETNLLVRSIKRLKQDAKILKKSTGISQRAALDQIAFQEIGIRNWDSLLFARHKKSNTTLLQDSTITPPVTSLFAAELGITNVELEYLDFEVSEKSSKDGLIYSYIVKFDDSCPLKILNKISGLENLTVEVSANAFDEPDYDDYLNVETASDMNPYRKLLVHGVNELIKLKKIKLDDEPTHEESKNLYCECVIYGYKSIVVCNEISHGEIQVSVWWKYNHDKHPQANSIGRSKESFNLSSPLAKRSHYPKFVGIVCSAWLERKTNKHLQGTGNEFIHDRYTRKGELNELKRLSNPVPNGFEVEGKIFL